MDFKAYIKIASKTTFQLATHIYFTHLCDIPSSTERLRKTLKETLLSKLLLIHLKNKKFQLPN